MAADVYISEFLASNSEGLRDEDGDASDWVEIFNAGPGDVNLGDWFLTDNAEELDKWSFPDQTLAAGNFLLVYASSKDRTEVGEPLHTNFRLGAGGEYLGLTRYDGEQGEIKVVSEFAPEFREQQSDISYGRTHVVESRSLVEPTNAARMLLASVAPANWFSADFNDASWAHGTAAIGYQSTVAGFTVQNARSSSQLLNLSEADSVLHGIGVVSETTSITSVVNFQDIDGGGATGNFGDDAAFPNDSPADDNDFAVRATGTIEIPTAGIWTFGTNSDDGVRVRIDGKLVIDDDTLHAPEDRFGSIDLTTGPHDLELTYFERGGGAEVELFAAKGTYQSFDTAFRLVGDVNNGGLTVTTSAGGGTTDLGSLIHTDVLDTIYEKGAMAYLRIPFNVASPDELDSLALQMHYDDGFVAYLNGTEIARRNAPATLSSNATASTNRSIQEAILLETIDVSSYLSTLRTGQNVLAIVGLNDAADSNEFLLSARLGEVSVRQGELAFFRDPSPGNFNPSTGVENFLLNDITFSQPHGFYEDDIAVTIASGTAGTSIRYTLDGTEPTETNGVAYSGPVTVTSTTTLRARSFLPSTEPSYVETATYIFLADVLQQSPTGQPPEGFPARTTINGQLLDYGMDPEIVNSARWEPQLIAALTQIPTMSLVMDIDDLLGASAGIYTHAQSHGLAWERPASLELMNPDGSEGFQVEAGVRIRGGYSRSQNNPKHAFRLFFRDEYGDSKLEYPLFGDEGASSFDKIDLRTSQNYSWSFEGSARNTFLRDIFSRDIQGLMGQPYTRGEYYHLYINGQYWGLYQTDERPEANYAASYFGGSSADYDVVKSSGSSGGYQNEATDGSLDAYRRLAEMFYQANGLSDANRDDYYRAQGMNPDGTRNPDYERLLDVDNLIDYMVITYYTSDADGPGSKFTRPRVNNYFAIYNRENPDGFKFFEHDSEHSLDTGNAAGANYNMVTPLTTGGSEFRYFNPQWMHEKLAQTNSEYRLQFADAVYRHLFHDGVLTADNALRVLNSRAAEINLAVIAESARWGDSKRGAPLTQANWESAVDVTRKWIQERRDVVLAQLRNQGWYPELSAPEFFIAAESQQGGDVVGTLKLEQGTASLEYSTLVEAGSTWKYLDDGSNQGTTWRQFGYDDTAWKSGKGPFGYGDGDENTVVSYGPNSQDKYRTTYFRSSFTVDELAQIDGALVQLVRDDGAVVYLNGQEVGRSNMPQGAINYLTFANDTVGDTGESTFVDLAVDTSALRVGRNELAVEIHQVNAISSDISFDLRFLVGQFAPSDSGILYTLDGSDPRLVGGSPSPNARPYDGTGIAIADESVVSARSFQSGVWSPLSRGIFRPGQVTFAGDFNADHLINAQDIDILFAAIRQESTDAIFDLDGNRRLDARDHLYLVETILETHYGDIDLDGSVGFADFLVLAANFGRTTGTGWSDGDLDGDQQVSFRDFLNLAVNY